MANTRILCVDDDQKILNGIQRQQGDDYDITVALGPQEALEIIENEGPFAVVLSDMRMPEMNGVELLSRVRAISPDSVRMILTGFADLDSTIAAVNEGHIFRFLSKPCSEEHLSAAFDAGLRQHALVEAERELVEGTLHGSVKVLCDVLSLVCPLAFGQSTRVRAIVDGIVKRLEIDEPWKVEIAAMLSGLGCVTLPPELLDKRFSGQQLSESEMEQFAGHPAIGAELIRPIPRLDKVGDIIAAQAASTDGKHGQPDEGQILKLAIEFDTVELASESSLHALAQLKKNAGDYDERIIEALSDYVTTERDLEFTEVMLDQIRGGMVLAQDVKDADGCLLMSKGQEISPSASRLLENFSRNRCIEEPIKVVITKQARTTANV